MNKLTIALYSACTFLITSPALAGYAGRARYNEDYSSGGGDASVWWILIAMLVVIRAAMAAYEHFTDPMRDYKKEMK